MDHVTCIDISVFTDALTRGKTYEVLSLNIQNQQIKIIGDNYRTRWFPLYCFNEGATAVIRLINFRLDDPISSPEVDNIDVTITVALNNDMQPITQQRWYYFVTPAYIYRRCSLGTNEPVILNKHGLVVPILTYEQIQTALNYLEVHNLLEACTLPLALP